MIDKLGGRLLRDITLVASGTAVAQVITMLASPFITRLYGPENFGMAGVFIASVLLLSSISSGTYSLAIALPQDIKKSIALVKLSLFVSGIYSIFLGGCFLFGKNFILDCSGIPDNFKYLMLLPFAIFLVSALDIMYQWMMRERLFRVSSKIAVVQSLLINSSKLVAGLFYPFAIVLIYIYIIGNLLYTLMLINFSKIWNVNSEEFTGKEYKEVAKEYKRFPFYKMPEVLVNSISQNFLVIALLAWFGPASSGYYVLAKTIMGIPSLLIGKSVGDVMYPKIAEKYRKGEEITALLVGSTVAMLVVGIFPCAAVIIFGELIFSFVFGGEWSTAGKYAGWISVWLLLAFASRPCIKAVDVMSIQHIYLLISIIFLGVRLAGAYFAYTTTSNELYCIAIFSILSSFYYLFTVMYVVLKSKRMAV